MKGCQQKYCTVKVNEGLILLKETLRSNSAQWLRPLALEANWVGIPVLLLISHVTLYKLLNVSTPKFLPL